MPKDRSSKQPNVNIISEKYIYLRDEYTRKPIQMRCYLLAENGDVGLGISVCSTKDAFDREDKKAYWRAWRALIGAKGKENEGGDTMEVRRDEAFDVMACISPEDLGKVYVRYEKSVLNPPLTDFEKKVIYSVPKGV